jgi:acyl-coenzyme A synthetase/AMP-(fatty) acid ligase
VDAVVESFEHTRDVCAFAVDDAMYGQAVAMAVVLDRQDDATLSALYSWMKDRLAEPKMPGRWWLVDEIPRTARGKINRESVRAACSGRAPLDLNRILERE